MRFLIDTNVNYTYYQMIDGKRIFHACQLLNGTRVKSGNCDWREVGFLSFDETHTGI